MATIDKSNADGARELEEALAGPKNPPTMPKRTAVHDDRLEKALKETFPASDPVSIMRQEDAFAAPPVDEPHRRKVTVETEVRSTEEKSTT